MVRNTLQSTSWITHAGTYLLLPAGRVSATTDLYSPTDSELPQDIFNYPLRRDLIYRLYDFRLKLNRFTSKMTKNRGQTSGSGKKMRPQKGQGVARMGSKRAPHLWKGGKAHGAKPRVFSYPLNAKIKINALRALLSAKLAEGKIKIVDSE
ncbi:MAG: 50S ribosomal protein L4 [Bdellovibrionales bacterium]|nr:50S ribosomal protein L4 [Bdellovibrionales bacterium]